ncbi:MAG: type I restriction endonuclease subunit R [Proteobacteria bacterium]|nr:type I restriction endonuclease subunit R [Pseudomonadota bacterium]
MADHAFTEATRVQMTALLHLTRIGYTYIGKPHLNPNLVHDEATNIILPIFEQQFKKLNPHAKTTPQAVLADIRKELDDDDLGKQFYRRLTAVYPVRLIDFEHPENNLFQCTAEMPCVNGNESFRPDITLFINGMPLVFIEVKKPNNTNGMIAESTRLNCERFANKKFRRFINITQLMIFSNNMEYDAKGGVTPIEGVFYCTAAHSKAQFNCFREENPKRRPIAPFHERYEYEPLKEITEKWILNDFNVPMLRDNPEYNTNKDVNSPTNRVLTSMVSPERLLYLLQYGIAYVHDEREENGQIQTRDEKHIMRYPQFFASRAILNKIDHGQKSGIVWHTQGSGKTALSFYLTKLLQDHYAKRNIVTKFYFIVDRLDLLEQAADEFAARGLKVIKVNSRNELMDQFKTLQSLEGHSGESEITVVNIQKFKDDKSKVDLPDYAVNLQRIFIVDEAHRGYKKDGCFLANLLNADRNSIKIALTGTPLIGEDKNSRDVFNEYYHTYYYDRSIQDGYTLKIIREDIETSYRKHLRSVYEDLENIASDEQVVKKGSIKKSQIIEHPTYVKALLRYIIHDLKRFRAIRGDSSLGGMIICETSEQARKLYEFFDEVQDELSERGKNAKLKAGLILFDSDDKETRKQIINDFKKNNKIDILIVFNMLLTGFDAHRLKRLYFGRKLKDHNLLQAITRVNRPYKDMQYGYVIDFADIKQNFYETNEAYLRELNRYNDIDPDTGDALPDMFTQVMANQDELIKQMKDAQQALFNYSTDNAEVFATEISSLEDKRVLIELRRVMTLAKDAYNLVRCFGDDALKKKFEKLDIERLPLMLKEVNHRIALINQKEAFAEDTTAIVNEAMLDIEFNFCCIGTEELKIIDGGSELQEKYHRAIAAFINNFDHDDPEWITLNEHFNEIFRKHGFKPENIAAYNEQNAEISEILKRLEELERANAALLKKYNGDTKFAYVHKRIREENSARANTQHPPMLSFYEPEIVDTLLEVKRSIDTKVYDRNDILKQDAYFAQTVMNEIDNSLSEHEGCALDFDDYVFIQERIAKQYVEEYHRFWG